MLARTWWAPDIATRIGTATPISAPSLKRALFVPVKLSMLLASSVSSPPPPSRVIVTRASPSAVTVTSGLPSTALGLRKPIVALAVAVVVVVVAVGVAMLPRLVWCWDWYWNWPLAGREKFTLSRHLSLLVPCGTPFRKAGWTIIPDGGLRWVVGVDAGRADPCSRARTLLA